MKNLQMHNALRGFLKYWCPAGILKDWQQYRFDADRTSLREEPRFLLPELPVASLFPTIGRTEVRMPWSQMRSEDVAMIMPLTEYLLLGALCATLRPKRVFEIGTYTGSTTLLMAINCPHDAEIHTLDYNVGGYETGAIYKLHPGACERIRQLSGDSRTFDYGPLAGTMDLVLIDGNHSYEFARSDSENAFKLIRPGGVILWDDYVWSAKYPECIGVSQYLHELFSTEPCYRIAGTRLAVHIDRLSS